MPLAGLGYSLRFYLRRLWSHLVKMSGVAGNVPFTESAILRPPDQFRSSIEEHVLPERSEYNVFYAYIHNVSVKY